MELSKFNSLTKDELKHFDVLILGVKPTQLKEVFESATELKHFAGEVISTLAGVTLATLKTSFPLAKVHSRLMPSIVMAEISSTALMLTTDKQSSILSTWYQEPVGNLHLVNNDEQIDQLTLIFGSNAAYISALIAPWIENLAKYVSTEDATKLSIDQWIKALQFLKGKDLLEVISKVKTPGGITAQALVTLDEQKYSHTITKAISASSERAVAVGELVNRDLSSSSHLQSK